jgi:probable F420-dependent oxidoreductase
MSGARALIEYGAAVGSQRILIVNADDFGQSPGINQGVVRAHEEGIVTSATLMVRWPAASEAADYAREHPALSVGLHLDLAEWEYREDGGWLQRYEVAPTDDESAVSAEIDRQLTAFLRLVGRQPSHLDSHQHVHLTEPVSRLLAQAGRRLGVPVRHLSPGPSYNGAFYGQDSKGSPVPGAITVDSLVSIIHNLPEGVTELACHPGGGTDLETAYRRERATEVDTLCSPLVRAAIDENDVQLRSFADLRWTSPPRAQAVPPTHAGPRTRIVGMTRRHAFRFGVSAHEAVSGDEWRGLCRKVEDLGFSTLLVPDHLGNQLSPMPALAAAAEAARSVRLGVLVSCNDFRHPVVHAKELATLDVLSGGRIEWGMGAGWLRPEFEVAGMSFDPGGVRVARLQEAVAVMKGLFADGPTTYAGEYYRVNALTGRPRPLQRPHPPLLIGGAGKRMLTFAAGAADIIGIGPSWSARRFGTALPTETVVEAADCQLRWIAEAAGGRLDDIEINMVAFPAIVTTDAEARAAEVAPSLRLAPPEVLASPHVWIGTVDQICESLEERRERWGVSYWVIPATAIDALAPIVDRLAGR